MPTHKILIVDNDHAIASDLEARLVARGFEVTAIASSGREAIALADQTQPNLILMNVALGGDMDGVAAAGAIRLRTPIPVIFMVDCSDEDTLRRVREIQPFGYVSKPLVDRELQVHIDVALRNDEVVRPLNGVEEPFFAVSIDLLCCLDFTGYFKRLNPAWERTLGFTIAELMAKPFIDFVHPDDRERTLKQNRSVRAVGENALSFENRYLCKDGSYRWLRWNAAPDAEQQVIYSVARDITEQKCAEDEREQLVRELQAALAEVKTLQQILPICSYCRKIRDDENYWHTVEGYISRHTSSMFSHGICPTCYETEVVPDLKAFEKRVELPG